METTRWATKFAICPTYSKKWRFYNNIEDFEAEIDRRIAARPQFNPIPEHLTTGDLVAFLECRAQTSEETREKALELMDALSIKAVFLG